MSKQVVTDCDGQHGLPLNPLRVRVGQASNGTWWARYSRRNDRYLVTGASSRQVALADLKHSVRIKVEHRDGKFVEVR